MAQLSKYNRAELRKVAREAYREYDDPSKYENCVNPEKTDRNYNMSDDIHGSVDLIHAVDDRIAEIVEEKMDGKAPKNEPKVGSIVTTLPKQLSYEQCGSYRPEAEFFADLWDFFRARYGEKNVIDMVIHCDETTPHCTTYIVPECISRKNGKPTISAASLWQRQELQDLHKDLDAYMEEQFGIKHLIVRSEEEREKDPKNLTLREYKLLMAQAGNNQAYADLTKGAVRKADKIVSVAQQKADAIIAEAEKKAAEILAQARAQTRALPQVPKQPQQGGYERTYA